MRKIRIGNDIAVQWSLVAKGTGEPFVVEGKDIRLSLKSIFATTEIEDFTAQGNTIAWTFKGAEQKQTGIYSLEVSLLDEQGVMITTDVCDFVELVACSCEIGGMDATGVHTESIELVSDVDVAAGIDLSKYLTKTEAQTTYQPQEKGKGLSTNDYTTAEKNKLAGLQNYDDTEIRQELTELSARIEENEVLISDLQNTKIDKEADDYYPQLSVGTADNLSGVDEVDSEFSFRRSGGGAIADGVARVQSIKGNSVVWNQWAKSFEEAYEKPYFDDGITYNGNKVTIDNWHSYQPFRFDIKCSTAKDHLYLVLLNYANTNPDQPIYIEFGGENSFPQNIGNIAYFHRNIIYNNDYKDAFTLYMSDTMEGTVTLSDLQVIDLTKMFGAGNEPSTIEEYNARKPIVEDEYAYNEGEVIHMNAEGISSKGVNAWDEEWENGTINLGNGVNEASPNNIRSKNFTKVLSGHTYHFLGTFAVAYYDKDKNFVDWFSIGVSRELPIPQNVEFIKICTTTGNVNTYKNDICINISNADVNGKYYPYTENAEDLSIVAKYFPNGMRSAGSAHDEIRYNKQTNKWEKVVRVGEVDLGTLDWGYDTSQRFFTLDRLPIALDKYAPNITNAYGYFSSDAPIGTRFTHLALGQYESQLYIYNENYTDVATFKAAMQGVILYYELANPIVTEIKEKDFNLDYKVWNCGTEQMVASKPSSALSADITYGFNAVGLIKQLRSMLQALSAKVANL